jgi:hypothetical protein
LSIENSLVSLGCLVSLFGFTLLILQINGAFILCFFFTIAWLKALKEYWIDAKQNKLSNKEYYLLLVDAVDKLENGNHRLDYKDYIKRIMKEALNAR